MDGGFFPVMQLLLLLVDVKHSTVRPAPLLS
jgi:hypothetical protein